MRTREGRPPTGLYAEYGDDDFEENSPPSRRMGGGSKARGHSCPMDDATLRSSKRGYPTSSASVCPPLAIVANRRCVSLNSEAMQ